MSRHVLKEAPAEALVAAAEALVPRRLDTAAGARAHQHATKLRLVIIKLICILMTLAEGSAAGHAVRRPVVVFDGLQTHLLLQRHTSLSADRSYWCDADSTQCSRPEVVGQRCMTGIHPDVLEHAPAACLF